MKLIKQPSSKDGSYGTEYLLGYKHGSQAQLEDDKKEYNKLKNQKEANEYALRRIIENMVEITPEEARGILLFIDSFIHIDCDCLDCQLVKPLISKLRPIAGKDV